MLITSGTDYKTDNIIQQSLRCELGKDVTVITVAHRLQTIMDADKIVGFWKYFLFLILSSETDDMIF
jgi:ABC-type multidrug transport system fused ATPase/permease subunit